MIPRPHPVLVGRNVRLEPFSADDINDAYLAWLNDPEVNRYSRRAAQRPITRVDARDYLATLAPDEVVLAIRHLEHGHVGNIKYGPVNWQESRADISILIGDRRVWSRGVGGEAVYLASRFLLSDLGLDRVDAGSANPAFVRMVERLGWRVEGIRRGAMQTADGPMDQTLVALSAADFRRLPRYETAPTQQTSMTANG